MLIMEHARLCNLQYTRRVAYSIDSQDCFVAMWVQRHGDVKPTFQTFYFRTCSFPNCNLHFKTLSDSSGGLLS